MDPLYKSINCNLPSNPSILLLSSFKLNPAPFHTYFLSLVQIHLIVFYLSPQFNSAFLFFFSKNMKITHDTTTNGCISNILRHILPKNYTDHSKFSAATNETITQQETMPSSSPCLVARLMGLETMPTCDPYTPKKMIVRSRSTNSVENWNGYLCGKMSGSVKHKASRSFREEPTFISKENDEFLVLNFAPREERLHENTCSNGEKTVGRDHALHDDIEKIKPVRMEERCKRHEECKKATKKSKETRSSNFKSVDVEVEGSSRESSPVSVLDSFTDIDIQLSPISEELKKPDIENSRKKLSSSKQKSESYSFQKSEFNKASKEGQVKTNTIVQLNRIKRRQIVLLDTWAEICLLTELEVKKLNLNFSDISQCSKHNKEAAIALGEQLLNFLLTELLNELLIL